VIYVATSADAIHVLHTFQKKSQKQRQRDLDLPPRACESSNEDGNDESSNLHHVRGRP
jgi:phage-related protein